MFRIAGTVVFVVMLLVSFAVAQSRRGDDIGGRRGDDLGGRRGDDLGGRRSDDIGGRRSDDIGGRRSDDFGGRRSDDFGSRRPRDDRFAPTLYLGEKRVSFREDKDTIRINQGEEYFRNLAFTALVFRVYDNNVDFNNVKLAFIDSSAQPIELPLGRRVRQGDVVRVPLPFPMSYLSRIEMSYKSDPKNLDFATVAVLGEVEPPRRTPVSRHDEWVPISYCKSVKVLGHDVDRFHARGEGRFRALRVLVRHGPVELFNMKVKYEGDPHPYHVPIQDIVDPERTSEAFELHQVGQLLPIEVIEMAYRSLTRPSDVVLGYRIPRPEVCVEGLKSVRDIPPVPPGVPR